MALIEKGWRVLFTRTTDLVQKLQIARRDLVLEAAIATRQILSADPQRSRLCHPGSSRDQRSVRAYQRSLRTTINAHHRQSAIRRMGQNLPRSSHDSRGDRPPRPSRYNPRNECRQLSPERSCRQGPWSWAPTNARDNQGVVLIVAPRQSNSRSRKYRLRYRRAATIILSPRPPKWPS